MRVIIDTNVLISAVFFQGKPAVILEAWITGKIEIVLSTDILNEYSEVIERLSAKFPSVEISGILSILTAGCRIVEPEISEKQVCDDRDDDKFIATALSGKTNIIVSGDKHLLDVNGYSGIHYLLI